jgi:hypothetical protein
MSQKQRITYDSELDALVAVAKQLSRYEDRYRISSEDFFHRFSSGQMEDTVEFVEWSNAYRHFLSLRGIIEKQVCLQNDLPPLVPMPKEQLRKQGF